MKSYREFRVDGRICQIGRGHAHALTKKAAAVAIVEAWKNKWNMAIALVDTGGYLVYFEKMQDTQTGSVELAIEKARTSALFRRPTKVFQEAVAAGANALR